MLKDTFIEQLRDWLEKGVLEERVEWGVISSEIYQRMDIIDFYERAVAQGNARPADATWREYALSLGTWKKFKHDMYITSSQKRIEKLRRWDRETNKSQQSS